MKKYRLPLTCALVVLLSLALPFAVFSLWDKALLSAPHSQTAAQGLSAEARANSTACTLYACSHVLNVPLGYNSGSENPWAQTAIDDATLDRARNLPKPWPSAPKTTKPPPGTPPPAPAA